MRADSPSHKDFKAGALRPGWVLSGVSSNLTPNIVGEPGSQGPGGHGVGEPVSAIVVLGLKPDDLG